MLCGFMLGCPKPDSATVEDATITALKKKAKTDPSVRPLLEKMLLLKAKHMVELKKLAESLDREQDRQAKTRHWLYVIGAALVAASLVSLAGKLVKVFSWATGWVGMLLAWVGKKFKWHEVAICGLLGAGCIAGAIWTDLLWSYLMSFGKVVLVVAYGYAAWQLGYRHGTGKWDEVGDGK